MSSLRSSRLPTAIKTISAILSIVLIVITFHLVIAANPQKRFVDGILCYIAKIQTDKIYVGEFCTNPIKVAYDDL